MATLKDIQARLGRVTERLEQAETVKGGAFYSPSQPAVSKETQDAAAKKRERYGDEGLANLFIELGEANKSFRYLWDEGVLSNPTAYLREQVEDRTGRKQYKVKTKELERMIQFKLAKDAGRVGMGFGEWTGKMYNSIASGMERAAQQGLFGRENTNAVMKAITYNTSASSGTPLVGGGVLIRTDLEPLIREAYLRYFPALDAIPSIPANGLVHSYNLRTDPGTAAFVTETADLSSASGVTSASTYQRTANSNIGVLAAQRGISLKLQYAIGQSGMNYDMSGSEGMEITAALQAIAKLDQATLFQGNYSTAAKTKDDEEGASNTSAYDGYRTLLKAYGITLAGGQTLRDAIDQATGQMLNAGADASNILGFWSVGAKRYANAELQQFMRLNDGRPDRVDNNLAGNGYLTVPDWPVTMMAIPADAQTNGLGYYTYNGVVTEDVTLIEPEQSAMAYLGSDSPVILELPLGYNNVLANVYIVFCMHGLVVYMPQRNRKVRIPYQTV